MINLFKVRDVESGRLYAFLTLKDCNVFVDEFDHPENLVGVDER